MANSYQIIDEKTWERAMHCMVFRNSVEPAFCVTFEADITNFKHTVKEQGLSFTLAKVVNIPMIDDLKEYCELASKTADEQKEYFTGPLGNDVFQCSPMPWVT
ncbi:MAG: CatA-like O-acetyltransferase, partial [Anaerostipes sp.]|nr:CatA-like O-acetyltransferase [Anaerostipes sp.]